MRNKYSVLYHYPVPNAGFTTSSKYYFKTWILAKLTHLFLKRVCKLRGKHHWTLFSYISKFSVDTYVGVFFQDEGPWRSYHLVAAGDTLTELFETAEIGEIDQDGETLDFYRLEDAPTEVQQEVEKILKRLVA